MNLKSVASVVRGEMVGGDVEFDRLTIDSRTVSGGELFIAVKGDHVDGHDFVSGAAEAGAAAALVARPVTTGLPYVVVEDTLKALGELAAHHRGQFQLPLIAITGSNGKTTVKQMVGAILLGVADTLVSEGNFNNHIGMPLSLLSLTAAHRYAVLEMGMNHPGEIAYLTTIARPTVALINNAAPAHLEGLGDVTGVARAKAEIFRGLERGGAAVINADDRFAAYWLGRARKFRTVTFGLDNKADVTADLESLNGVTRLQLRLPDETVNVSLPLLGRHNVRNALAAAAACWSVGVSAADIQRGLEGLTPIRGRLEPRLGLAGSLVLDDTYNANPASLNAGIEVLVKRRGRHILVLGDMAELGQHTEAFHRAAGKAAREAGVDLLFAVGEGTRYTVNEFGRGAAHYPSKNGLVEALRKEMDASSVVLVKGSRSAQMETIVAEVCAPESRETAA